MMQKIKQFKQKGLTLAELSLVTAALAIISFGAVVVTDGVLDNARVSAIQQQIQNIQTASQLAFVDTSCRTRSLNFLVEPDDPSQHSCSAAKPPGWNGPYLRNAKVDPDKDTDDLGVYDLSGIVGNASIYVKANSASPPITYMAIYTNHEIGTVLYDNLCINLTTAVAGLSRSTNCAATAVSDLSALTIYLTQ